MIFLSVSRLTPFCSKPYQCATDSTSLFSLSVDELAPVCMKSHQFSRVCHNRTLALAADRLSLEDRSKSSSGVQVSGALPPFPTPTKPTQSPSILCLRLYARERASRAGTSLPEISGLWIDCRCPTRNRTPGFFERGQPGVEILGLAALRDIKLRDACSQF